MGNGKQDGFATILLQNNTHMYAVLVGIVSKETGAASVGN